MLVRRRQLRQGSAHREERATDVNSGQHSPQETGGLPEPAPARDTFPGEFQNTVKNKKIRIIRIFMFLWYNHIVRRDSMIHILRSEIDGLTLFKDEGYV